MWNQPKQLVKNAAPAFRIANKRKEMRKSQMTRLLNKLGIVLMIHQST